MGCRPPGTTGPSGPSVLRLARRKKGKTRHAIWLVHRSVIALGAHKYRQKLATSPDRIAFLSECDRALARVLRDHHLPSDLALLLPRLGMRPIDRALNDPLRRRQRERSEASGLWPPTNAFRSIPEEKPLPAPVRTPTLSSSSASSSSSAAATPSASAALTALRASGRLSVTSRTPSRRSVRTASFSSVIAAGAYSPCTTRDAAPSSRIKYAAVAIIGSEISRM